MADAAFRKIPSSFRDPSGFLFTADGALYRQVNERCRADYDALMASGLYKDLAGAGLLIAHEEVRAAAPAPELCYKILKPEAIPFISYPYEWCFSQLKDAALAVLEIQSKAVEAGMSLKDASAYNIQFRKNRPVLIDTLSIERYREGLPWVAYGQFCRHFLAPLAMMSCGDARLAQLLRVFLDGIPLDLASQLLDARTRLRFGLLAHIHLHAGYQKRFAAEPVSMKCRAMTKTALLGLVDSLRSAVSSLRRRTAGAGWSGYYSDTIYGPGALAEKERIVSAFLDKARAKTVWDLGSNTGRFSSIAAAKGMETVSFDADELCVEMNYLACRKEGRTNVLPLVMDLTNPSPASGWEHGERASLIDRGPADMALALALVHHLAIANNLPLGRIAGFFGRICSSAVVEFVPKNDPQVKRLLASREDIFPDYSRKGFEEAFSELFTIKESADVPGTERSIYLMLKKR